MWENTDHVGLIKTGAGMRKRINKVECKLGNWVFVKIHHQVPLEITGVERCAHPPVRTSLLDFWHMKALKGGKASPLLSPNLSAQTGSTGSRQRRRHYLPGRHRTGFRRIILSRRNPRPGKGFAELHMHQTKVLHFLAQIYDHFLILSVSKFTWEVSSNFGLPHLQF